MAMDRDTRVTPLEVRKAAKLFERSGFQPVNTSLNIDEKPRKGEHFWRNLGVSAALVLCAVTLRTGAVPQLSEAAELVMTAATDDSLLDERLGKLSFVSAMFPEAVLVFGQQAAQEIEAPVSDSMIVHAWTEEEPYISWETDGGEVKAAIAGEVTGVYHGYEDEKLVQIMNDEGLACLYGNLADVLVSVGDQVRAGDRIGQLLPYADLVFELRQNGVSVDPVSMIR